MCSDSTDLLSYFPLPEPRKTQIQVIQAIDKAFKSGKKIVILRAPVGSGKSAVAMTFARAAEQSHIITPRKSLQDQYFGDYEDDIVLMKGRSAYPCTKDATPTFYKRVINAVKRGQVKAPGRDDISCRSAPCNESPKVFTECTQGADSLGPCPYNVAMDLAISHKIVVHNTYSFLFQANFSEKFDTRELMVIDEAHELPETIREFRIRKFTVRGEVEELDCPQENDLDSWGEFLLQEKFVPKESHADVARKEADENFKSERDKYLDQVALFVSSEGFFRPGFSVRRSAYSVHGKVISTTFEFIPHSIGDSVSKLLLSYGQKVILMSGTFYDHKTDCGYLGIDPNEAVSIEVSSSFPVKNRPIYLKPDYQVDTSHKGWRENFDELITKLVKILSVFKDVKGLIHAPSYKAMNEIAEAMPEPYKSRLMTHDKFNFQDRLEEFYDSTGPRVFVSPVCQQGVDFKDDRARFQCILRVPYLNTGDPFVNHMVKTNFNWYNYQALIIFGQQTGRINRNEKDFGATFLMDERFNQFVAKNSRLLPKWLKDSFTY